MKHLTIILLFISSNAYAGNRVGNGGDVVHCKNPETFEILDFHEATRNSKKILKSQKSDPYEIVQERIEPLRAIAPSLFIQYSRRLKTLPDDIEFRSDIELTDVKDSLHAFIGEKCKIKQVAIRVAFPQYNKKKPFVFDKKLWEALDKNHQAGLLLHEVFYEHLHKLGVTDSRPVRQFVAFLFSNEVAKTSKPEFWAKINEWGVPIYPQ